MNTDLVIFIIANIIAYIIGTVWIAIYLTRPYTLADLILFPDDDAFDNIDTACNVQTLSIVRWIPGMNVIFFGVMSVLLLLAVGLIGFDLMYQHVIKHWLSGIVFIYRNTIRYGLSKITFK